MTMTTEPALRTNGTMPMSRVMRFVIAFLIAVNVVSFAQLFVSLPNNPTKSSRMRTAFTEEPPGALVLAVIEQPTEPPILETPTPAPTTPPPTPTPSPTPRPTRPKAPMVAEPHVEIEYGTTGIVLCLYDQVFPLGASLIVELRCLGNDELIEVHHCSELSADHQRLLQDIDANIRIVDVCANLVEQRVLTPKFARTFRGYWIKALALHQTTLEHVIVIDADALLLRDPAVLRNVSGYQDTGTLFFYDRVIAEPNYFNRPYAVNLGDEDQVRYLPWWIENFDYDRFNLTYAPSAQLNASFAFRNETCHEMDSSLVVIDKSRAGKAMSILWYLMTEHRFEMVFSHGDKEGFWLAYEFAHVPYFFSPWGASVLSSKPNNDVNKYEATLCGCLCHYMPIEDPTPELLYVNGRNILDALPFNLEDIRNLHPSLLYNVLPTHMTPRQPRTARKPKQGEKYDNECLAGLGKTPTPRTLLSALWRRRIHILAVSMNLFPPLQFCDVGGAPDQFEVDNA